VDVDLRHDRHLRLEHKVNGGIVLEQGGRDATLRHIRNLWGYEVSLAGVDAETGATVYERSTSQIG
jgi:stage V sporulation protein R